MDMRESVQKAHFAEGRTMQINNSVNVGYYIQQPNKQERKKGIEFWGAGDNFLSDQTVRNQRAAETTDHREIYRAWMSHGANAVNVVKAYEESDITANTAEKTGAVSIAYTGKKEAQEETTDYEKLLQEKIKEILLKIENGDTEPSYQIGAQSFTEKEWEKFMDQFDSVEEAVKELMKEEQEEKEAEREAEKEAEEARQNLK